MACGYAPALPPNHYNSTPGTELASKLATHPRISCSRRALSARPSVSSKATQLGWLFGLAAQPRSRAAAEPLRTSAAAVAEPRSCGAKILTSKRATNLVPTLLQCKIAHLHLHPASLEACARTLGVVLLSARGMYENLFETNKTPRSHRTTCILSGWVAVRWW